MSLLLTSVIRVLGPHAELFSLNYRKGQNTLTFYTKRGEGLKIYLAITKFKSLSIYYKFVACLICLTNFLGRMISSSISAGKSCASGSDKLIGRLGHCREMGKEQ